MKNIFYILLGVLFFSCGNKEIKDNNWNPLVTLKTPVASANPLGQYTVEYLFDYDKTSLELKAEPSSDFNSTTLTLGQNNKDSIRFSFRILENAQEDDYSIVLTDIVSKYNGKTLSKDIILKDRILTGEDKWDIEFTEDLYDPEFEYKIPIQSWLYWTLLIGSIVILLTVLFLILKMDNMPLGKQTFENGRISFNNPQLDMVRLEEMQEFDLGK